MEQIKGVYAAGLSVLDENLALDVKNTIKHAENVIDLGCLPDTEFKHLEESIKALKKLKLKVSVDSANENELLRLITQNDKKPVLFKAEKDIEVNLCGCKQSENAPYCNGSHLNV